MNSVHDDEENFSKGFRTEPKKLNRDFLSSKQLRKPLSEVKENIYSVFEPKDSNGKLTLSEPVSLLKSKSRVIQSNSSKDEMQKNSKPKKHKINLNAARLAKILEYDTFIEDELGPDESDELKLFKFLEKEGRLSSKILKAFSKCSVIQNISMTNSYAGIVSESGLLSASKYSAILCTKPFYNGFQQILSLDFTNVKLSDDELRYLIRLPKLQALGLSGTAITDKGIKYLSVHSAFKTSLRCLKLCFVQGISDFSINFLKSFPKLKGLDLRESGNITMNGCHNLVDEALKDWLIGSSIKLPQKIQNRLLEMSEFYKATSKSDSNIITDPKDVRVENLTVTELKYQLKLHKTIYPNIYLNEDPDELRKKLASILRIRRKEEILLKHCFN